MVEVQAVMQSQLLNVPSLAAKPVVQLGLVANTPHKSDKRLNGDTWIDLIADSRIEDTWRLSCTGKSISIIFLC